MMSDAVMITLPDKPLDAPNINGNSGRSALARKSKARALTLADAHAITQCLRHVGACRSCRKFAALYVPRLSCCLPPVMYAVLTLAENRRLTTSPPSAAGRRWRHWRV